MYFLTFTILLLLSIIEYNKIFINNKVTYLYLIITVSLFVGLKGNVGTDTVNYEMFYRNVDVVDGVLEYFFTSSIKISNFFGLSFNAFLFSCTFLSVYLYTLAYKKTIQSNLLVFSFLIYFSDLFMYYNMSGLRQGLALSFVFLSSFYALNKKTVYFVCVVAIASLFHKSAIISLLIYPAINIEISYNKRFFMFTIVGTIILHYFSKNYLFNITGIDIKGAEMYLSEDYNEFSISAYLIGILRRIYPVFFVFSCYHIYCKNSYGMKTLNVYLLGLAIYIATYPIFPDVTVRITSYFFIFESFLFVFIACSIKPKLNRVAFYSFVLFVMLYKIFQYSSLQSYSYVFMDGIM
ncbi:EpsG family protein [Vibrio cyclitrophicus]|uniref:EpsG family protein n=1 Tax=Vibrio cyclitrophicus TaxID=47951 RepID=UPI000C86464A|nr:EpsG family protein [Vibrio cyclitrophicus]PMH74637.1 hypothetical protein BCU59_02400 [Vibrio cyclitrophicus]